MTFLRDPVSRRRFLRLSGAGAAGGAATLLAACGGDGDEDGGGGRSDADVLNSALDLEHRAVAAYASTARLLRGDALALGRRLLKHERAHAAGLARAIRDLGGRPNGPRASYDLPDLRGREDVLEFALELEDMAIAAYIDALPRLAGPRLRALVATIVTTEAEHVAALRAALGRDPLPDAFVDGARG